MGSFGVRVCPLRLFQFLFLSGGSIRIAIYLSIYQHQAG